TMAMYEAGYGSSSRLYERAGGQLGMTPATYRHGGRATRIRYTLADCPLGRLLLAATERGVCAVRLGDDDRTLTAGLAGEYPAALVIPCHRAVRGDGGLGGYRWGLARKQKLLEQERRARREP